MDFKVEPITVTGYHGSSKKAADKIVSAGFLPSTQDWEWLGHGIYFWQDAPHRAYEWGRDWLARKNYEGPIAVVAAEISLRNFVDLLDTPGMRLLSALAPVLLDNDDVKKLSNARALNRLDCALFNHATKVLSSGGTEIAGYRAACVEGKPLTLGSPVHDLSHVQIVVANPQSILRTWVVQEI